MFSPATDYFCEKCKNWKTSVSKKKCDNYDGWSELRQPQSDYYLNHCRNYDEDKSFNIQKIDDLKRS